jgi:hypothetical protein
VLGLQFGAYKSATVAKPQNVIGYSFPFFNREIDKQIFESLKGSGRLKKGILPRPI